MNLKKSEILVFLTVRIMLPNRATVFVEKKDKKKFKKNRKFVFIFFFAEILFLLQKRRSKTSKKLMNFRG